MSLKGTGCGPLSSFTGPIDAVPSTPTSTVRSDAAGPLLAAEPGATRAAASPPSHKIGTVSLGRTQTKEQAIAQFFKESVTNFRAILQKMIDQSYPPDQLQKFITENFVHLVGAAATLAEQNLAARGLKCPTEYAIGGMGSLSRGEASPYSDLDFAIIIRHETEDIKEYFVEFTTEMNKLISSMDDVAIKFCTGELNPPYRQETIFKGNAISRSLGSPQLIHTPQELAKHSLATSNVETSDGKPIGAEARHIVNGLTHLGLLHGSKGLMEEYRQAQTQLYRRKLAPEELEDRNIPKNFTVGKKRAIECMKRGSEYTTAVGNLSRSTGVIDIKQGVLRPIQQVIMGLCLFHGIEESNITAAIDLLVERKHMHPTLGGLLKEIYGATNAIRTKAQMKALKEIDKVTRAAGSVAADYKLSKQESDLIDRAKIVLIRLQQLSDDFVLSNGTKNSFANDG